MKTSLLTATLIACLSSACVHAQASLATCSKKKIRQMELIERKHNTSTRRKKYSRRIDVRQQVEQIDVWLWRNCRTHAEEMRQIEQQYM